MKVSSNNFFRTRGIAASRDSVGLDDLVQPASLLNEIALIGGIVALVRMKAATTAPALRWSIILLVVGTGLHFLGDLFVDPATFDEHTEHMLVHLTLIAMLVPVFMMPTKSA
ncbi:MAG: hypothetical protein ACYDCK_10685 [Thermoplasmatota archaeon]